MKKLTLMTLLVLLWTTPLFAAGKQYALEVAGLACPFCAYGIEKKLNGIDGVEDVEIHIGESKTIVILREGATLSEEQARQAIKEAGFTLGSFNLVQEGEPDESGQ